MNFSYLDLTIIVVYLVGVTVFGILKSGKQKTTKDYFLGGEEMKWWAVGFSIFATAIPVHLITGLSYADSILIIGVFTLVYTYLGGLKAVVAMDVVQLFIYLSGAVVTVILILNYLPNGMSDVVKYAASGDNKFA